MSLTYVSPKRGRVYVRKFDHEEAQRRYDAGESYKELAAEYGVTPNAVWNVVTAAGRRASARSQENQRARTVGQGRCERCGAPTNLQAQRYGSRLCRSCVADDRATSVRESELLCHGCGEWKADEDFPHKSSARVRRRGRSSYCRACETLARQRYRERHKVPCVGCGRPALPPNEKGTSGGSEPRCRACFYAARRVQGGAEARPSHRQETASSASPH